VVTHQLQVERRTGKVRQSDTDVLPLCYATNRKSYMTTTNWYFFADNVEGALLLSQFLVTILLSQFFADNYKSIFADNIKGAVVEKLLS